MRRFSIQILMAIVIGSAVGLAALRNADDFWAGGMIVATPLLFGVALIAALCGQERSRARRLGFAILGGGYFALVFLGFSERNVVRMPTSWLLLQVHLRVAPPQFFTYTGTLSPPPAAPGTFVPASSTNVAVNFVASTVTSVANPPVNPNAGVVCCRARRISRRSASSVTACSPCSWA
jgi:hypothetical protein